MKLVDTHLHLWDRRQFPYSWTEGVAPLSRDFLITDYLEAAKGCGISKAIFMEADVDEPHLLDEARAIQQLAERYPIIGGIIANARPEQEGFAEHLDALRRLPLLSGIRRVLHTQPDDLPTQPLFIENLQLLGQYGLPFDYCALPHQLKIAAEVIAQCPHTAFVLDHCGIPDVKGGTLDPWREDMARLAKLPNVLACKVSGIVAYADPASWSVETLRPWFDHVVECFGWDRLVWGGDWPVCTLTASLKEWVDATAALAANASDAERAKLYRHNAERIYAV
ncbi:MAG: amidohydrolase [Verrucomicrobiota bacterium JB022]|nr:amidohydrolase [Verrucomicrobiota bacterium JB022]